ncbi:MAG: type VI secretion system needle protein Hcp, partial [Candidatus Symbiothrix sp.]|nr:type VI secretion system needle protein Hcp [Candidatus Symbiothrix sp.]
MNLMNLAHIVAKFTLEGKQYEVEHFGITFAQPSDYKGQPQHEITGGQITLVLAESADDNLYEWAKKSTQLKDGEITFET